MGKFSYINKISKKEQEELFIDFAKAISSLHSSVEVAQFIKDLLSEQETIMLARRLQIAKMLLNGMTYQQITRFMKVGYGTIARVQTWLRLYGEGYRTVLERTKKYKENTAEDYMSPWRMVKKKYPMYFWPQLLLEEIIKSANKKEKQKLKKIVEQMSEKTQLAKNLTKLLNDKYYHTS